MVITITNEAPFQVLTGAFTIGPSPTGYELQVGATPDSFTTLFSVGANTPRMVTNVANGSYYRLKNNVGEVKVNWSHTCIDNKGGGSGSGTTYTAGDYISLEGDVISVTGITPSSYATHAEVTAATENLASENYVDAAITAATQNMATEQDIQTAMASETARTENTYAKPADIPSLAGYATEAYVTAATQGFMTEADVTAITSPIQTQLDDVEMVTATAYTELHQDIVALSGATSGYATHAEVTAATQNLASQDYVTSAVTAATQDMATQAYVTGITSPMQTAINNKVTGVGITTMEKISQADYDDLVSGGTVDSGTFYVITGSTS